MRKHKVFSRSLYFLALILFLQITGCEEIQSPNTENSLDDSLDTVEDVSLIEGAEDVTLIVNAGDQSYFTLEFQGIKPNSIIANGIVEGWCIDWKTPISSTNSTYHGIKLYSTYGTESWKEFNTLINLKEVIMADDLSITWREIQTAIWVLRSRPVFDLENLKPADLPSDMVQNGQLLFSKEKVKEIVEIVKSASKTFSYSDHSYFAIVVETPSDIQTLITIAE